MPSCINCKNFTGDAITQITDKGSQTYLFCKIGENYNLIKERDALDENRECENYVADLRNDDAA